MWIATKPFRYRGVRYQAGDVVPAERWPSRKALVAIRKIRQEADPIPEPTPVLFNTLKRAELNKFATEQGIEDAEGYSNRESLIEKLEEVLAPQSGDEGSDSTATSEEWEEWKESAEPEVVETEEISFDDLDDETEEAPQE